MFASGLGGIGIDHILNFICEFPPAPVERRLAEATEVLSFQRRSGGEIRVQTATKGPPALAPDAATTIAATPCFLIVRTPSKRRILPYQNPVPIWNWKRCNRSPGWSLMG